MTRIEKFVNGFKYAGKGLSYAFRTQLNFRVHVLSFILVTALSFYLKISPEEWLWILGASALVLMAELFNTAIETLVDLVSPDYNVKAGIVKDVSAAAVLVSAIFAVLTGLIILLPKLLHAS